MIVAGCFPSWITVAMRRNVGVWCIGTLRWISSPAPRMLARRVYETPGGTILSAAHRAIAQPQGLMPERRVFKWPKPRRKILFDRSITSLKFSGGMGALQ